MTKEQYLEIRNYNDMDVMPVMFYLYNLETKLSKLSGDEFHQVIGLFLKHPLNRLKWSSMIEVAFVKLNKHFGV